MSTNQSVITYEHTEAIPLSVSTRNPEYIVLSPIVTDDSDVDIANLCRANQIHLSKFSFEFTIASCAALAWN